MSFGHLKKSARGILALTLMLSAYGCIFTEDEIPQSTLNNTKNNIGSCDDTSQCFDTQTQTCKNVPARSCRNADGLCKVLGTEEDCQLCDDSCGPEQACVSINAQSQCLDVEIGPDTCVLDVADPDSSDRACEDGLVCQRGPNGDVCVPPCDSEQDCGPNQRCDILPDQFPESPTRCVAQCQNDDECQDGERCDAGTCVQDTPTGCGTGCETGSVCVEFMNDSRCLSECTDAAACDPGEECTLVDGSQVCLPVEGRSCEPSQCTVKEPNQEPLPWDGGRQVGEAKCMGDECVISCNAGFERFGGSPITGTEYTCWSSRSTISSGVEHTCVSLFDEVGEGNAPLHHAYCWGQTQRQTNGEQDSSITLIKQENIIEVAAGRAHTCALDKSNTLYCFGDNSTRQLGADNPAGPEIFPPTLGNSTIQGLEITAGSDFTCLLTLTGEVACWGLNDNKQLGHNQGRVIRNVLLGTQPLRGIESVQAGPQYACAVNSLGELYCWGNYPGQLSSAMGAQRVSTPSPVKQLALGGRHICYINPNSEVLCMGENGRAQLGSMTPQNRNTFERVDLNAAGKAVSLSAGADHSCAVLANGQNPKLICWGSNGARQAVPSRSEAVVPPTLVELTETNSGCQLERVMMGLGRAHSCALLIEKCAAGNLNDRQRVMCWGANEQGQSSPLVMGSPVTSPTTVKELCSNGITGVNSCRPVF